MRATADARRLGTQASYHATVIIAGAESSGRGTSTRLPGHPVLATGVLPAHQGIPSQNRIRFSF